MRPKLVDLTLALAARGPQRLPREKAMATTARSSGTQPERSFAVERHEFTWALGGSKSFASRQRVHDLDLSVGQRDVLDEDDAGLASLANGFVFLGFHGPIVLPPECREVGVAAGGSPIPAQYTG